MQGLRKDPTRSRKQVKTTPYPGGSNPMVGISRERTAKGFGTFGEYRPVLLIFPAESTILYYEIPDRDTQRNPGTFSGEV